MLRWKVFLHTRDKLGENEMGNLYHPLGVMPFITGDELKQRFRYLAQAYHPDKFASDKNKLQTKKDFKKNL